MRRAWWVVVYDTGTTSLTSSGVPGAPLLDRRLAVLIKQKLLTRNYDGEQGRKTFAVLAVLAVLSEVHKAGVESTKDHNV